MDSCPVVKSGSVRFQDLRHEDQKCNLTEGYLWVTPVGDKPKENNYTCMWGHCHIQMSSTSDLDAHLDFHCKSFLDSMKNSTENLSCQVRGCEILVSSPEELLRHSKMHIFHAQKIFAGLVQIRRHHAELTSCYFPSSSRLVYQGDALSCEWNNCGKNFIDINKYMEHFSEHIDSECLAPYACKWRSGDQQCHRSLKTKGLLRLHVQYHSGDKAYACPFCGMFFSNKTKLFDHVLRRQKGDSQFSCQSCQKTFQTSRLLNQHCKRHLRNFRCNICALMLLNTTDLQRHIRNVHAKVNDFFCEVCGKRFYQKYDLSRHMNVHSDVLSYECAVCKEKFRWEKQLRHHSKIHKEDYVECPYHCHLCNANYSRGGTLTKHLKSQHNMTVPIGFSRFHYKKCADSLFRLQTRRWTGNETFDETATTQEAALLSNFNENNLNAF